MLIHRHRKKPEKTEIYVSFRLKKEIEKEIQKAPPDCRQMAVGRRFLMRMVLAKGFEPPTHGLGNRRSIH